MTISQVIILAIIQGLTEFLPVSSSGHLLAARIWLHISDEGGVAFDAILHLGTLGAVLTYYWRTWVKLGKGLWNIRMDSKERRLIAALAVATVPAAIMGYAFEGVVEEWFRSPKSLAGALMITAVILVIMDRWPLAKTGKSHITLKDAVIIGLAQVLALAPGVSRSGMTMAAGRMRGLSRKQAAKFSFLMSAPIIAGAGLAHVPALLEQNQSQDLLMLSVGLFMAFISGLAAIGIFMRLIERISLTPFAIYLVILAGLLAMYG